MCRRYLFLFVILFFCQAVYADLGPKPSMEFIFNYNIPVNNIVSGEQYECNNQDCTNASVLADYGPQGFRCSNNACRSMAYGYDSEYHKIVITFNDKIRESNVFKTNSFNAKFNVDVFDDKLIVTETINNAKINTIVNFFKSLLITLVLECFTAFIFFKITKKNMRFLVQIIVVNCITLPLFWLSVFMLQDLSSLILLFILPVLYLLFTIVVIILEAVMLYLFTKKSISLGYSFLLSFIMNFVSSVIGGIILLFFLSFGAG